MSITVKVEASNLQEIVRSVNELHGAVAGDKIKSEMGFAIAQVIRRHFSQLAQDTEHHRTAESLGANRTGFYERARAGTQDPVIEPEGVSVSIIAQGIAQRLFGGTIKAKQGSFLTIPALAVAYGKRARSFNLRLVIFGDTGLAALIEKGKPKDEGSVYYWLVRSVTQAPDPTVLPTEDEMQLSAKENALAFIEQTWANAA